MMRLFSTLLVLCALFSLNNTSAQVTAFSKSNDALLDGTVGEVITGQTITYTIKFSGNNIDNLVLIDNLPAELTFVPGSLTTTSAFSGCTISTPTGSGGAINISCPGNFSASMQEIVYQAVVGDISGVQNLNQLLINDAEVNGDVSGSSFAFFASSSVRAKMVTLQKNVLTDGSPIPGETVSYTLDFQISEFADLSALTIEDILPDGLMFLNVTNFSLSTAGGTVNPTQTPMPNGGTLVEWDLFSQFSASQLAGATGIIEYDAQIMQTFSSGDNILANDRLTNEAAINYELTNGLTGSDENSAIFVIPPPTFEKNEISVGPYEPGDNVTFQLNMYIPSGDANGVELTDFFPFGIFDLSAIDLTFGGANIGYDSNSGFQSIIPTVNLNGNALELDFGDISSNSDTIISVLITAPIDANTTVTGDRSNLFFITSTNTVGFTSTPPGTSEDFSLGNAEMVIVKFAETVDANGNPLQFDAGDTVSYLISIKNEGTAGAQGVVVTEVPSPGIGNCIVTGVTTGLGIPLAPSGDLTTGLNIIGSVFPNSTINISVDCVLSDLAEVGDSVGNIAMVSWDTDEEAISEEVFVDIIGPEISKTVLSSSLASTTGSSVAVGETVQFSSIIVLPEGTSPLVSFVDNLPAGMSFVSVDQIIVDSDLTSSLGAFPTPGSETLTGTGFSLNFGDIVNNGNLNDGSDETVEIIYTVLIDNTGGNTLTNNAEWNWGGQSINDNETVNIVDTDIAFDKTISGVSNDLVTVDLTIENIGTSGAAAYAIDIQDVLDGAIFDVNNVNPVNIPNGFTIVNNAGTVSIQSDPNAGEPANSLEQGESITFTFSVGILSTEQNCTDFVSNTATFTASSAPTNGVPISTETDSDDLDLPTFDVLKTISSLPANGGFFVAGEAITYAVEINNNGPIALSNLDLSDLVPAGLTFVPNSITLNGSSAGSYSGNTVNVNIPNVPVNGTATIEFEATIDAFINPITISNQASVVNTGVYSQPVLSDDPSTNPNDLKEDDPTEFTLCVPPSLSIAPINECADLGPVCTAGCEVFMFNNTDFLGDVSVTVNETGNYQIEIQEWNGSSFESPSFVANGLTATINDLDEGLYQILATNLANNCANTLCFNIVNTDHAVAIDFELDNCGLTNLVDFDGTSSSTDVDYMCPDGTSGSIPNTITSYSWTSDPATVIFDDPLSATPMGTFPPNVANTNYVIRLEITDQYGCVDSDPFVLTQPGFVSISAESNNCDFNASPTISISGGSPTWTLYLYPLGSAFQAGGNGSLTSVTTTQSGQFATGQFTGITVAGNYTIYGEDGQDCVTEGIDVEILNPIDFTLGSQACNFNTLVLGGNITGGNDPNDFGSTGYTLEIQAGAGTVIQTLNVVGNSTSGQQFTNVPSGNYNLVIIDESGCELAIPIEVYDEINVTTNLPECVYGELDITVSGGQPKDPNYSLSNYTIVSSTNGTLGNADVNGVFSATGLPFGTQTLTIQYQHVNANGVTTTTTCSETVDFIVAEAIQLDIDESACSSNEINFNGVSGGADPSVFGSGNYTIDLVENGTVFQSLNSNGNNIAGNFTGVPAGIYDLVVTDADNCTETFSIEVYDPIGITNETSICDYNGLTVSIVGGQPGLSSQSFTNYQISSDIDGLLGNADMTGAFVATNLSSGSHTITVSYDYIDFNGNVTTTNCSETIAITIIDPIGVAFDETGCVFEEIDFDEIVGGNGGPYNVALLDNMGLTVNSFTTNGQNITDNFTGLTEGNYDLLITDSQGCQTTVVGEVYDPIEFNVNQTSCVYGTLNLTVTGGQPNHPSYSPGNYTLSSNIDGDLGTLDGSGNLIASNLSAGNHIIVVLYEHLDSDGNPTGDICAENLNVSIYQAIELELGGEDCSFNEIIINGITGGIDPAFTTGATYDVEVFFGGSSVANQTVNTNTPALVFNGLAAGNYTVTVTDDENCSENITVEVADGITVDGTTGNCVDGVVTLSIAGAPTGTLFTVSSDIDGVLGTTTATTNYNTPSLSTGLHTFTVSYTDDNGLECSETFEIAVTNPIVLDLSNNLCDFNTVSIDNIYGGYDPTVFAGNVYTVTLLDGSTVVQTTDISTNIAFNVFEGVSAGVYTVAIEDSLGCTAQGSIQVFDEIVITANSDECDYGMVDLTISGGAPEYNNTLQDYEIISSLDGLLGNADVNGNFTADLTGGNHILIVSYVFNGLTCTETYPVEIIQAMDIDITDNCEYGNIYSNVSGGQTNGNSLTYNLYQGSAPPVNTNVIDNNTTGNFSNLAAGTYFVEIIENTCTFIEEFEVYEPLVLSLIDNSLCGVIEVNAVGGTGDLTYSINPNTDIDGNVVADNVDGIFMNLSGGNYTISITDANNCASTEIYSVVPPILIDMMAYPCSDGIEIEGGQLPLTYDLYTPDGNTLLASNQTGVFPNTNGDYFLIVYDGFGCADSSLINCLPPINCDDVLVEAVPVCLNEIDFEINLNIQGPGTFTVTDINNVVQTGVTPGVLNYGPFVSNTDYAFTVISELDSTCIKEAIGTENCFNCDLMATVNTTCDGFSNYNVELILAGSGTYTIEDIDGNILPGVSSGTLSFGPYASETNYSFVITSEIESDCSQTIINSVDCFTCDLVATPTETCIDLLSYEVELMLSGTGTYSIDDGIGSVQTGVTAGMINFGPYQNNDSYTFTITSEVESDCGQIVTGENDCFVCDLSAIVSPVCSDLLDEYNVEIELSGSGTYSIDDGNGNIQSSISSGDYVIGPFANESNYNVTITSELNADCSDTYTGTEDCFECDVNTSVETTCIDLETYEISLTLSGAGTYIVSDGINVPDLNVAAGVYTYGPYPSENTIDFTITSEVENDCSEDVSVLADCYECDLTYDVEAICVDEFTYNIEVNVQGSGTFMIDNGMTVQNNQSAGIYNFGPFANGGNYNIVVTSEIENDCSEEITGTSDCFDCTLSIDSEFTCSDDLSSYIVDVTFTGIGTYTIDDGMTVQTGVSAGSLTFGPYLNETSYQVIITSENDPTCTETISGTEDCFDCDLSVSAETICEDITGYLVELTLTGSGTYSISTPTGIEQANIGAGTYQVGPFDNNTSYDLTITSDAEASCEDNLIGTSDCFECNATLSAETECLDLNSFNVVLTITGGGTYI